MWTETTQQQYRRDSLRYASDVTDQEWALIEGFLPRPRKLGRPHHRNARGCQCPVVPVDNGLSVATVAQGISAVLDGPAIFLSMAGCWAVADDQSFFGDVRTRGQWP